MAMEQITPRFRPGVPGVVPDAWIVGPEDAGTAAPVVVVHGITRGVAEMVDVLLPRIRDTGRTVVLPHFDVQGWRRYQRAACKARADWALLRLMSDLRAEGRVRSGRFDLSGFSGGAQFAHRFAWMYPDLVGRLCATAPGWWTFPDPDIAWPEGMGAPGGRHAAQGFRLATNLRAFLSRRIVVSVGSDDVAQDRNLRQSPEINAQQGETRVTRARRWCEAAEAQAHALGVAPRISLRVLQGCRHDFTECVTRAGLDRDFIVPAPATGRCGGCHNAGACRQADRVQLIERIAA